MIAFFWDTRRTVLIKLAKEVTELGTRRKQLDVGDHVAQGAVEVAPAHRREELQPAMGRDSPEENL